MAITVVQHATNYDPPSGTCTFASPTTAGNCVVVFIYTYALSSQTILTTGCTLGGSADNFAQVTALQTVPVGGDTDYLGAWIDPDCAGGQTQVVANVENATWQGEFTGTGLIIYELAGVAASSPVDRLSSASGTTGTAANSGTTSGTTTAGEMALGAAINATTFTALDSSYTAVTMGSPVSCPSGYKTVPSAGTGVSYTATNATSNVWAAIVFTLTPATAPPPSSGLSLSSTGTGLWGDIALVFSGSPGAGASGSATGTGAPSLSLTTTADNSAVGVIVLDHNAVSGASRTWRTVNGVTPTAGNGYELDYTLVASEYGVYVAYYPNAGLTGSKVTVGLSAPAGMKYTITAVEIQGTVNPVYTARLNVGLSLVALTAWENAKATLPVGLAVTASSVGYVLDSATLGIGFTLGNTSAVEYSARLPVATTLKSSAEGWIYIGPVPLTYPQYLARKGTLIATSGEFFYYITPASGWPYALALPPPDGRWITGNEGGGGSMGIALHPRTPAPLATRVKRHGMRSRSAYAEMGKRK